MMARTGVRSDSIIASLMRYSQESLKGVVDRTVRRRGRSFKPLVHVRCGHVDTVYRMPTCFLERVDEEDEESGYDTDSTGHHHGSLLKVGSEIAGDPYLTQQKFIAIIERLPDYARM
ncbi:hypothetical protein F2Q69_00019673 [Brassica cretica]|uniref:Uncharacterized protein n=1 Tax=Brassica cretica TaxID=69181 RepID=A0A8S9QSQ1_BRACR|nr:hypothetical protein F2Q69_00019673 [Brassica cretica]